MSSGEKTEIEQPSVGSVTSFDATSDENGVVLSLDEKRKPWWYRLYTDPWFQISLISLICFCCPGMYNALSGMGGSGQVDATNSANATVALLSCTAGSALFLAAPLFKYLGPRWSLLIGAWTYALYSGSLLNYNRTQNGAFVIAAGAILGIGAAFLWIAQGAIMICYTSEETRGRAIALFWIVFNLGGGIGSLASLGINYNSHVGTVTSSTYIAYIVIMMFGWAISILICPADSLSKKYKGVAVEKELETKVALSKPKFSNLLHDLKYLGSVLMDWRILCLVPLFYNANIFYSYQQNSINGMNFNIRTRALNSALYWIAQMFGGLIMGATVDYAGKTRRTRAIVGWAVLFVTGFAIWGGGYSFQKWSTARIASGLKQDIDFTDGGKKYVGPMFLYIFYGCYDAFWQSFIYWLIGVRTTDPQQSAVLVGLYTTCKAAGGAMAWRINAEKKTAMVQFAMNWGLCIGCLVVALPTVLTVKEKEEIVEPEAQTAAKLNPEEAEV